VVQVLLLLEDHVNLVTLTVLNVQEQWIDVHHALLVSLSMLVLPDVYQLLDALMVKILAMESASIFVTKVSFILKEFVFMEVASQAIPPMHSEDVSDNPAQQPLKEEILPLAIKINLSPMDNVSAHVLVDSTVILTQDNV
jgi:hypothetical protein